MVDIDWAHWEHYCQNSSTFLPSQDRRTSSAYIIVHIDMLLRT